MELNQIIDLQKLYDRTIDLDNPLFKSALKFLKNEELTLLNNSFDLITTHFAFIYLELKVNKYCLITENLGFNVVTEIEYFCGSDCDHAEVKDFIQAQDQFCIFYQKLYNICYDVGLTRPCYSIGFELDSLNKNWCKDTFVEICETFPKINGGSIPLIVEFYPNSLKDLFEWSKNVIYGNEVRGYILSVAIKNNSDIDFCGQINFKTLSETIKKEILYSFNNSRNAFKFCKIVKRILCDDGYIYVGPYEKYSSFIELLDEDFLSRFRFFGQKKRVIFLYPMTEKWIKKILAYFKFVSNSSYPISLKKMQELSSFGVFKDRSKRFKEVIFAGCSFFAFLLCYKRGKTRIPKFVLFMIFERI